jgi:exopolyphosphatase/pppGpp-phosphohydrolase
VAETLGLGGYTLCDWGLREGLLLETALSDAIRAR